MQALAIAVFASVLLMVSSAPAPILPGLAAAGAAGAAFSIPAGLSLAGAGALTVPTYLLLLKGLALKKALLLSGGAAGAGLALNAGINANANANVGRDGNYYRRY